MVGQESEPNFVGAACAGLPAGSFFPERGTAQITARDAKAVCNGTGSVPVCPVKQTCLEYALERKERFGIWGGMSERERAKVAKQRRVAAKKRELEIEQTRRRRSEAARLVWENRRRAAVEQQEQAAKVATRSKRKKETRATNPRYRGRAARAA